MNKVQEDAIRATMLEEQRTEHDQLCAEYDTLMPESTQSKRPAQADRDGAESGCGTGRLPPELAGGRVEKMLSMVQEKATLNLEQFMSKLQQEAVEYRADCRG